MILALHIGNEQTVVGLLQGEQVVGEVRITTRGRTADELGLFLLSVLAHRGLGPDALTGAILSSVVPDVVADHEAACAQWLGVRPLVVGRSLKTRLKVRTDNPREVGADRIVHAVAAAERFGAPVIVVDLGTATTIDCVNALGEYVGGAIAPGFKIGEEALAERTAKLPHVELAPPEAAIGRNTVSAIQSGLFYGYAGLVDALVRRCRDELGGRATVVATGRYAALVAPCCAEIGTVEPQLALIGLGMLHSRNQPSTR